METRATLLGCALTLFAARGYDAVGVQEIVAAAGVTKPTLYHHFGNKQGLLGALLERDSEPFLRGLGEAARYRHDLTLNLQDITDIYLDFVQAQPDFYRLLASCSLAPLESEAFRLGRPIQEQQLETLELLFEAASRDHGNMRGRERRYAMSFLGLLDSYARLLLAGAIVLDDALKYSIRQQFSYGIYS